MPEAISRIINITASEDASAAKLAEIVLMDQALSSRVLRLSNSAMYSRMKKTETVSEAIICLGSAQLRNLAASASVLDAVFPKRAFPGFNWKEMWRHSVICAVASQCIYGAMVGTIRSKDESVFIAGLLHDVGKMVIAYALPLKFTHIVAQCYEHDWDMMKSERRFLATNHALVGSDLASEWRLPDKLQIGISYHHSPESAPELEEIARAVSAGNMLAKRMGRCYINNMSWDISLEQVCDTAKLCVNDMLKVVTNTREGVANCKEILSWGDSMPETEKAAA